MPRSSSFITKILTNLQLTGFVQRTNKEIIDLTDNMSKVLTSKVPIHRHISTFVDGMLTFYVLIWTSARKRVACVTHNTASLHYTCKNNDQPTGQPAINQLTVGKTETHTHSVLTAIFPGWLAVWCSGNALVSINAVALHRARLVLGW